MSMSASTREGLEYAPAKISTVHLFQATERKTGVHKPFQRILPKDIGQNRHQYHKKKPIDRDDHPLQQMCLNTLQRFLLTVEERAMLAELLQSQKLQWMGAYCPSATPSVKEESKRPAYDAEVIPGFIIGFHTSDDEEE